VLSPFAYFKMGNDGGSIPRRIELVKEKQKDVKQNPNLQREAAWFYCALSKVKRGCMLKNDPVDRLLSIFPFIESFGTTYCGRSIRKTIQSRRCD
jgi:hypothetical protein